MSIATEHPMRTRVRRDAVYHMRMRSSPSADPDDLGKLDLELQSNVLLSAADEADLIEVQAALIITTIDNTLTQRDWDAAAGAAFELPFASTLLVFDEPVVEDYILDDIVYAAHLHREVDMYVNAISLMKTTSWNNVTSLSLETTTHIG
jgi:hypothetical protein